MIHEQLLEDKSHVDSIVSQRLVIKRTRICSDEMEMHPVLRPEHKISDALKRIMLLWSALLLCSVALSQQPLWRRASGTENFYTGAIDVYRKDPDTLYAIGQRQIGAWNLFMLSTDRGESWDSISYKGTANSTLKVDPTNSKIIYESIMGADPDGNDVYMTTDGGQTWRLISMGRLPGRMLEIDPVNPSVVYRGESNALARSTDRGQTWWAILIPGLSSSMAIFPTNDSILYVNAGGGISKSTDWGLTWSRPDALSGWMGIVLVDPRDANTVYFAQYGYGVSKSTDGGMTWVDMNNGLGWRDLDVYSFAMNQKHPDELFLGTNSDTVGNRVLFRSTDAGNHWIQFSNGLPDSAYVPAIVIDTLYDRVYVGIDGWNNGHADGIYILELKMLNTPYASGWNLISIPELMPDSHTSVLFPSSSSYAYTYEHGYVQTDTLSNGVGYWLKFNGKQTVTFYAPSVQCESVDVAKGWNIVGSVSSPVPVTSLSSEPGGMVTSQFIGYDGGYHDVDTIEPGKGYWVKVNQNGKLILASTGIGSFQQAALSSNRISIRPTDEQPPPPPRVDNSRDKTQVPIQFALSQNYPNPFNPTTVIGFSIPREDHIVLEVFNTIGQRVATLVDGRLDQGIHAVFFDASRFNSGMYCYRLRGSLGTITRKMLILR